ncbi:MAG: DNA adenine methylase [Planctomycetota bacterium]
MSDLESDHLTRQLITCIGNKRALLEPIEEAIREARRRLGGRKLRAVDAFAGSGVVSRLLVRHASHLVSNDLEDYAAALGRCFLRDRRRVDLGDLERIVADLNARVDHEPLAPGFVRELYAPRDEAEIRAEDRVFYTVENARRLDDYRRRLDELDRDRFDLLIGPLLARASVHANTAGVFKGFYKDRRTRIGRYGGSGADALTRIRGEIRLEVPVLAEHDCEVEVSRRDANELAREAGAFDLAYLDPPYNQHPYGSNYFMLNLLLHYRRPDATSRVSGIPRDWRRSGYNVRRRSEGLLRELVANLDARFVLVSFNDEGFIAPDAMRTLLAEHGRVEEIARRHAAFRGSRNLASRALHVTEHLFLVDRG